MSVLGLGSLETLTSGHGASVPGRFSLGKCSFGSPVLQQFITSGGIDRGSNFASQLQGWGEFRVFQSFRNFFWFHSRLDQTQILHTVSSLEQNDNIFLGKKPLYADIFFPIRVSVQQLQIREHEKAGASSGEEHALLNHVLSRCLRAQPPHTPPRTLRFVLSLCLIPMADYFTF